MINYEAIELKDLKEAQTHNAAREEEKKSDGEFSQQEYTAYLDQNLPKERFEKLFIELKKENTNTLSMEGTDLAFMYQHIMEVLNNPNENTQYKNKIKAALKIIKEKIVSDIQKNKRDLLEDQIEDIYRWTKEVSRETSLGKLLSISTPLFFWGAFTRSANTASLKKVTDALEENIGRRREYLLYRLECSIKAEENYLEAKEHLKAMTEAVAQQSGSRLNGFSKNKILEYYADWKHDKNLYQQFLSLYLHGHIDLLPDNFLINIYDIYEEEPNTTSFNATYQRARNALRWLASDDYLKHDDARYQCFFDIFYQTWINAGMSENITIKHLESILFNIISIKQSDDREQTSSERMKLAFIVWTIKNNHLESLKEIFTLFVTTEQRDDSILREKLCELAISLGHTNILQYLLGTLENSPHLTEEHRLYFINTFLRSAVNCEKSDIQECLFNYCSKQDPFLLTQINLSLDEKALFIDWATKNHRFEILPFLNNVALAQELHEVAELEAPKNANPVPRLNGRGFFSQAFRPAPSTANRASSSTAFAMTFE